MRGLPRPNCHSHGLTSYTLLPLLPSAAAASAVPNWNALPFRCRNLCGMVGVELPFSKFQEQGKKWHPAKHQITGADLQDGIRGLLVQLDGSMTWIHGSSGWHFELLNGADKHQMGLYVIWASRPGVVFGQPPILRTQQTLEKQLRACVPCVLDGHVGGILQAEGVRRNNKATT